MWIYRTGELCGVPPVILYVYEETRGGKHPKDFLSGCNGGFLTTDGYSGYHGVGNGIILTGCMAHCRRYFHDCLKVLPKSQWKGTVADEAVRRIALLYQIETLEKDATPEKRYEVRQKQSKPILDAFFEWLEPMESECDSKSLIGKAIGYALNQKKYLSAFLLDGNIPIDNLASERSVKPFVMGRKAWLFSNTPAGAESSGMIYSIVETAKANNCHPYHYLTHVLETIPRHMEDTSLDFLEDLLPWSDKLPEECKVKKIKTE